MLGEEEFGIPFNTVHFQDKLRKIVSFMVTCMGSSQSQLISQLFDAIPKKTRTHATAKCEENWIQYSRWVIRKNPLGENPN